MKKLLSIAFLLLAVASCQEKEEDGELNLSFDSLVFGQYYGMCFGEKCVEVYKLANGTLYEDTKDQYPGRQSYDGEYVKMSQAQYELAKDLADQVPAKLLLQPSGTIGSPDVTDGGGLYIEVNKDGSRQYYHIDKFRHNVPEYLHPFMDKVEESIRKLR